MNYWLNTVSRDHVRLGVAGGFTQANHGSPHNLRRMQRGDWLVFYSPRTQFRDGDPLQSFTAIGTISDDVPYQVEMNPTFKPFRRDVTFLPCQETAIRPLLADLDFIVDKKRWGYPFRRGLFQIGAADFSRIAAAMGVDIVVPLT